MLIRGIYEVVCKGMNSDEVHRKIFTGAKKQIIVSLQKKNKEQALILCKLHKERNGDYEKL